ncbi:serine/threonine protein kinase [Verrucomicrobiaceae bacterium N1E253]|uniref:Serine/threonine protein kinase n=1 Tax=Oceaniferula marina TaxID=2748318 RepID=A0A851GQ10_9BACT|nr:serine/threonine-protein kinase [Oceaniferula marina]NWK56910.1 serine/threonine protein kinase [Oceaniferula marina]
MDQPTVEPSEAIAPPFSLEELEEMLPAYSFERFLDSGAMGAVYQARQKSLDRAVAVKILHPELCQDQEFRTSFEREAKAMAKLNHRNLVAVYDFGEVKDMLYIVMKFIDGQSLHDSCAGKSLVPCEAAELVAGICRGLQHAHHHRILHRDIKPANILVDASFQANIVDFGIAEAVGTDFGNQAESFCTPDYAAPETHYQGCKLDARTDIYSVGVLFYELLTGELPGEERIPPSYLIADCPPAYDDVVLQAIHPDPNHRYQEAEAFAEAIEGLLNSTPEPEVAASHTPAPTAPTHSSPHAHFTHHCRTSPSNTQNKSKAGIGLAAALIVIGLLTYVFIQQLSKPDSQQPEPEWTPEPAQPQHAGSKGGEDISQAE